jgi:hypothetical protein
LPSLDDEEGLVRLYEGKDDLGGDDDHGGDLWKVNPAD